MIAARDRAYRISDDCVWPERRGLTCWIVYPSNRHEARIYPFHGLGKHEVVVWIDNDPLNGHWSRDWSCVLDRRNLAPYAPTAPVLELVAPPPDWVRERRKPGAVS